MTIFQSLPLILGIAMCGIVMVQLGLWAAQSLSLMSQSRRQFELSRKLLNQQIESVLDRRVAGAEQTSAADWTGYRTFVVSDVKKEAEGITSVYLKPEDGKSIPFFSAGQYLTLKVPVPGQSKPVIRCYSLSSAPAAKDLDHYRITVKAITTPLPSSTPELPQHHLGVASHFINRSVCPGDLIEVKAPAGHFVLDETSQLPIVLLAGGIGITPMLSMLQRLAQSGSQRMALLLYGVRNSGDHAFEEEIRQLAAANENIHAIRCFSQPLQTDVLNQHYQVHGRVSVDLLKQILPNNHYQFYVCGPSSFMGSIYHGLIQWQVPENRIAYEAFGPETIGRKQKVSAISSEGIEAKYDQLDPVTFVKSNQAVLWSANQNSLLELAEENGIFPDSGCRAGSCGSCETSLLQGKVQYPVGEAVDCPPGKCLLCLAKPDGPVELDV